MGIDSPTPLPLLNLFDKGPPFSIMAEGVHIDALRTKDWALIGARAFVQTGSLGRNILGQGSLIKQSCRLCIPPSTSSVRWGKSVSPSPKVNQALKYILDVYKVDVSKGKELVFQSLTPVDVPSALGIAFAIAFAIAVPIHSLASSYTVVTSILYPILTTLSV